MKGGVAECLEGGERVGGVWDRDDRGVPPEPWASTKDERSMVTTGVPLGVRTPESLLGLGDLTGELLADGVLLLAREGELGLGA